MTFDQILRVVLVGLEGANRAEVTLERIETECAHFVEALNPNLKMRLGDLVRAVQQHYGVIAYPGSLLAMEEHIEWLTEERIQAIKWTYWDAYRDFALDLDPDVKREIHDDMMKVLGRIQDPKRDGAWESKGLVMGSVQSGKTANYIGLMAKAMDAGYKVVIVLTGIHESLRSQTQGRINKGILGYAPVIQSGRLAQKEERNTKLPQKTYLKPFSLTTATSDFQRSVAELGLQQLIDQPVPLVFVVKKCAPILRNLYAWLAAHASEMQGGRRVVVGTPALIIDDEADQASIDVEVDFDEEGNQIGDPTTINALTRGLCHLFERSAYVAFTATPFANILIHDEIVAEQFHVLNATEKKRLTDLGKERQIKIDSGASKEELSQIERKIASVGLNVFLGNDLFPRNFIYSLNPPSNYFGPEEIFGMEDLESGDEIRPNLPILIPVGISMDSTPSQESLFCPHGHDKRFVPTQLPDSLKTAILTFMLASAQRNLRLGSDKERVNSMLIHVSRFTDVQGRIKNLVSLYVEEVRKAVTTQSDAAQTQEGTALRGIYYGSAEGSGFCDIAKQVAVAVGSQAPVGHIDSFDALYAEIRRIFNTQSRFDVLEVNGEAKDALIYDGKVDYSVIVVGGNKLSRGLTLEGLSVSYYLRNSDMYDTLLQMGRWFGYRSGYIDVMRVFSTEGLIRRFRHLARAITELRREFELLSLTPGATPKDFGLKILAHPEMTVTSLLKLRNGTRLKTSFSGESSETVIFGRADRNHNQAIVFQLAAEIATSCAVIEPIQDSATLGCKGVSWQIVERFVTEFRWGLGESKARNTPMTAYIRKMAEEKQELVKWNVYFRSNLAKSGDAAVLAQKTLLNLLDHPLLKKLKHPFVRTLVDKTDLSFEVKSTGGSSDESMDLSRPEKERASELADKWRKEIDTRLAGQHKRPNAIPEGIPPKAYRYARDPRVGRLLVYPLLFRSKDGKTCTEEVYWGARISFPGSANAIPIEYVVNNVYLGELELEGEVLA